MDRDKSSQGGEGQAQERLLDETGIDLLEQEGHQDGRDDDRKEDVESFPQRHGAIFNRNVDDVNRKIGDVRRRGIVR
jgi:hypothetical protein